VKKTLGEIIIETLIKASGAVSTIAVLLIVYYLFSEGLGLFSTPPIEEGYIAVVSENVPVEAVDVEVIRSIYNKKTINNWNQLGGPDQGVTALTIDNFDDLLPDSILNDDQLEIEEKLAAFIGQTPGTIAVLPKVYSAPTLNAGAQEVTLDKISFGDFLTGQAWIPTANPSPSFGILPLLAASLLVTFVSIIIAIPIGLITAIYMTQVASPKVRGIMKPIIELLAGVRSVVYGFFGLIIVVPLIQDWFDLPSGATALAGAVMLGIISLPTIITLSDDALRSVPIEMKESSLALGASDLQTTIRVLIPYALSGISSAAILGIGRSIGETMTVLMVTGNSSQMPTSVLDSVRTITATIALELGEAPKGGNHYEALFLLGCVVFLLTLIINIIAEYIASKQQVA